MQEPVSHSGPGQATGRGGAGARKASGVLPPDLSSIRGVLSLLWPCPGKGTCREVEPPRCGPSPGSGVTRGAAVSPAGAATCCTRGQFLALPYKRETIVLFVGPSAFSF